MTPTADVSPRIPASASVEDALLEVRHVDFSYGQVQVLFDVNLYVTKGEVLALLGTNGAGKSTVLRVVSGLSLASRGAVLLDGVDVTNLDPSDRVRAGIVQVPGGKALFPSLTVAENLDIGAHTFIRDRARVRRKTDEVLDHFPDLRERLNVHAGSLSGGQQQMLAIAKGLLLDPKILLIDELSLGLAPVAVQAILEVVSGLTAHGITMVLVEQSVNIALSIADRAIFMEKGTVRFEGPANELLERGDLVRAVFLGGEEG
jgi:ABC-type branched-subunit amino acid transport system ATPase component